MGRLHTGRTLRFINLPIRQYHKIEWLDWAENIIDDYTFDILDGSLSIDSSNDIRRSSMAVNNSNGLYIPNSARTNMGVKIALNVELKLLSVIIMES